MDLDDLVDWATQSLSLHPNPPCLLVVSPEVATLRQTAQRFAAATGWPLLNVGALLSAGLLDLPTRDRPSQVAPCLAVHLRDAGSSPRLLTELDLLFHPALQLDPLHLLRQLSHTGPLVAFWPGTYRRPTLTYAVAEHAHYRRWPAPGLPDTQIRLL